MAGELIRRLSTTALERQHGRDLEAIDHATEVGEAQVVGVNRLSKRAVFEAMCTELVVQQAERIAPEGRDVYTMIAVAGAVESIRVIENTNRRWSR